MKNEKRPAEDEVQIYLASHSSPLGEPRLVSVPADDFGHFCRHLDDLGIAWYFA